MLRLSSAVTTEHRGRCHECLVLLLVQQGDRVDLCGTIAEDSDVNIDRGKVAPHWKFGNRYCLRLDVRLWKGGKADSEWAATKVGTGRCWTRDEIMVTEGDIHEDI